MSRGHFARIPERFTAMLERRDVSFEAFGLMVYIVAKAWPTGECVIPSARALRDLVGMRRSDEHVRKLLHALIDAGEIECDVEERQRPWVIRVVDRVAFGFEKTDDCQQEGGAPLAVSANDSEQKNGSKPHEKTNEEAASLPRGSDPSLDRREERDSEQHQQAGQVEQKDSLRNLLELFPDAGPNTRAALERELSDLPAKAIEEVHESLVESDGVRNPARFALAVAKRVRKDLDRLRSVDPDTFARYTKA